MIFEIIIRLQAYSSSNVYKYTYHIDVVQWLTKWISRPLLVSSY